MKRVLCLTHDPGGTKAIVPVILALRARAGIECEVHAGRFAAEWLESQGVPFSPLPSNLDRAGAAALFRRDPALLLSATSWASNAEQMARNEAAARSVPSLVCFDYWLNYAKRFEGAAYPLAEAPDHIACADDAMAGEAAREGLPRSRLHVTGHPHLDFVARNRGAFLPVGRAPAGAIFLSEDYPEEFLRSLPEPPLLAAARAYGDWLKKSGQAEGDFHVKPHPKEEANAFLTETIDSVRRLPGLRVQVLPREVSLIHQLGRYRFAFGYQSMALQEARALGLGVVAIPLLKGDRYPSLSRAMEAQGIRLAAPSAPSVELALAEAARAEGTPSAGAYSGAAEKIAELAEALAGK